MKTFLARLFRAVPRPITRSLVGLMHTHFNITVVGAFFAPDGKVLILRHVFRKRYPWGLPAGYLGAGEAPETAAVREVREEIGIEVKVARVHSIRPIHPRQMEVVVVGTADAGQTLRPNFEIFEGAFVFPDALPPDMMPSQREVLRQVMAAREPPSPTAEA
jgi:8-oxo-dGTP pyrophosphatase MutT (NUDIX family)